MSSLTHLRRRSSWAVAALALTGLLVGCGAVPRDQAEQPGNSAPGGSTSAETPNTEPGSAPSPADSPAPEPVQLSANVKDGATDVKVDTLISVKAAAGTVTKVALSYKTKDDAGKPATVSVAGKLNAAKTAWTATGGLDPAATYQLTMTGKNASDAKTTVTKNTFTTQNLSLDQQTFPTLFPNSGSTVGVGMPVILTFDLPVKDKAEFEKHLAVVSTPKQTGSWRWVSDTEVHFRPKNYWQPGTKVQVSANLNGVNAGSGIYGQHSRDTSFAIGRSVVTKVNLQTKQAKVYIGGDLARTIPVSGGKPGFTSRSGTKLIMAKLRYTKMASETIGISKDNPEYYDLDVEYAMRVTATGEFLHAAPWNAANFGRVNSSHGCVGMSTANARWLFNTVTLGDPVVTTGTGRGLEQGNGWSDWDISYTEYAKGSAL